MNSKKQRQAQTTYLILASLFILSANTSGWKGAWGRNWVSFHKMVQMVFHGKSATSGFSISGKIR